MTDRSAPAGRCSCRPRLEAWARLDLEAAKRPCCTRACCQVRVFAVMVTDAEVQRWRAAAWAQQWRCPRCGERVTAHTDGFACVDRLTRRIRLMKQGRARWQRTGAGRR